MAAARARLLIRTKWKRLSTIHEVKPGECNNQHVSEPHSKIRVVVGTTALIIVPAIVGVQVREVSIAVWLR